MARVWSRFALASVCSAAFAGCMSQPEARSGALDYLTRKGSKAVDDAEVKLKLPVRVAIAVPPAGSATGPMRAGLPPTTHRISPETVSDRKRRELLDRFTNAFKGRPGVASVQVPTQVTSTGDRVPRAVTAREVDSLLTWTAKR